jgi:hydrophobe/amphiphile efflux-1 (HAE1) family protein
VILSRISIQRPVLASMMSLMLVLFGAIGLSRLPVRELPDMDPPIVSVTALYPGANAGVVETEVTERLEEAVSNIEGIKTLTSTSREQFSSITIEFDLSRNIDLAAQDVRDRVARVRGRLPNSVEEPVVAKQSADANPVIWIGLNSDRYSPVELTALAEKQIKNRLQVVRGVSSVTFSARRYALRLWLDADRLAAHGVTVLDVQRALRQQNVELPSGRMENLSREMTLQTRGELRTAADFNRLVLRHEGARVVRLQDVGEARDGSEEERTIARVNGKPCIFLGIVKQSKGNVVDMARGIKAELARIRPTLPPGVEMHLSYDESVYVEQAIEEVWGSLGIAFFLVVLIVFFFLGHLRSTLIPAMAIPVSIIGTFALFHLLGYSVNILTMLALVLAIGVVVDDAIVVLENIHRHIEAGLSPMQAAFKGMEEIAFAVIAITLSLVAVFLPLAFQKSATGRLFVEFAVAVAGSVVISAFVALTLSPMMCARLLRPAADHKPWKIFRPFEWFLLQITAFYKRLLSGALRHRWVVLIIGAASCWLMFKSYALLEKEFLPDEDKGRLLCFLSTPEGSTAEYTDRMMRKMEARLQAVPELSTYGAVVAPSIAGPGQANSGIMFVRLKPDRERSVRDIVAGPQGLRAQFFDEIEGGIAIVQVPKAIGRGFSAPLQLVLQANDLEELDRFATRFVNKLRGSDYLLNVRSSYEVAKPELRLGIDRDRAAALGVSIEDIARTLQILFGGLDLSRVKLDSKEYDVIVQLERSSRMVPQDLDRLHVRSATGELIQLAALVRHEAVSAPNAIQHHNRLRSATLSATPTGMPLGTVMKLVEEQLREDLPAGFLYEWTGESADLKEAGSQTWWILSLALIIVYMVLAAQFESLLHPFTVMLAVPLAGLGAFGLLWLVGYAGKVGWIPFVPAMTLNLFSQIGLVLLVGLVTKNSILLVEFANQERAAGVPAREAMLRAGVVRLRPILMTAFSTIAGILPIAIGFGAGAESRRPMGIVVVGGMITSTFLTLVIIPVAYTLLSDMADRLSGLVRDKRPAA